ncbi:MAG: PD40 domain-containing protein, partial [Gemmatimonadetes bacterium]|nr:PD40 domain-containing protein [Gemmatimonadota bacterium]
MNDALERLKSALAERYTIQEELGAGGMATVYLAHDLKHERKVAVKVLRPELAAVLGAERFVQEIKTTANLQHPHILPLFDSGEADGFLYYVMPFIDGETLRDKLDRETQLGIDEAVRITTEVADALDYAHRHNVIHRDIKPENILLHDGRPMVADFGIALAVSAAAGGRMTETGLSLGTPHYMSPEQAMGDRELDARSDVYSLACVTYEMLVGEPPYTGPTAQAIVAKLITEKPQHITLHRDTVPAHIDAAVQKALAKLPADRFDTAAHFAEALSTPTAASARVTTESLQSSTLTIRVPVALQTATRLAKGRGLPWAIVALLAMTVGILVPRPGRDNASASSDPVRFSVTLPPEEQIADLPGVLLTRDGTAMLLVATRNDTTRLYIRYLNRQEIVPVAGTEGIERGPFLSPDGRWIAFVAETKLKKVSIDGGTPLELADARSAVGGSWGANDTIVYSPSYNGGLWQVGADGGAPLELTTPDRSRGELGHWWPQILPDGKHVLFTNFSTPIDRARISVLSLETGEQKDLVPGAIFGRYLPTGHLVFVRSQTLMAVPFDLSRLEVTGTALPVLEDLAMGPEQGSAGIAFSDNGIMAYVAASVWNAKSLLLWVDRSGNEDLVIETPDLYESPQLSPDGRRLAYTLYRGNRDVMVRDLARGVSTPLARGAAAEFGPLWTPDGERVIYQSDRPPYDIFWRDSDALGPEVPLLQNEYDNHASSVSPDGKILAYMENNPETQGDIWLLPLDGGDPTVYRNTEFSEKSPAFSPDGRWIAYSSNESGRFEVYVQSYPDPTEARQQVSTDGGTEPLWARDGSELFYRNGEKMMTA